MRQGSRRCCRRAARFGVSLGNGTPSLGSAPISVRPVATGAQFGSAPATIVRPKPALARGPDELELGDAAAGAARNIDGRAQAKDTAGDLRPTSCPVSAPDHGVAAEPGVQRRGVVVPAVAPQHKQPGAAVRAVHRPCGDRTAVAVDRNRAQHRRLSLRREKLGAAGAVHRRALLQTVLHCGTERCDAQSRRWRELCHSAG